MFFLILLKNFIKGSKLDRFIRIILNYLTPQYYKISNKFEYSNNNNFVFICYGGLGDCILLIPLLNQLSIKYSLTVFIEHNLKDIRYLLDTNIKVKSYFKKNLLKNLQAFQRETNNIILIQQSPIIEFVLFHYFLKRPPTIGFIYKQDIISCEGINLLDKKIESLNKIFKYKALLEFICSINIQNNRKYKNTYINNFSYKAIPKKKYYILSPTKNHNWKMGFFAFETYAKLIIKLTEQCDLIPVIVGTKMDCMIINQILDYIPKKIILKNLVGKTSIKNLIPLIKDAQFIIANDNGIHHLSNYLKKRTLTLYNFSSYKTYNWPNKNSDYMFNPIFNCMPCVGEDNGPSDNYPFKCPWDIRCKNTLIETNIIKKLGDLKWIN